MYNRTFDYHLLSVFVTYYNKGKNRNMPIFHHDRDVVIHKCDIAWAAKFYEPKEARYDKRPKIKTTLYTFRKPNHCYKNLRRLQGDCEPSYG